MSNKHLQRAKEQADDEFYTPAYIVEEELKHYSFNGLNVYSPCDSPESEYTKYFVNNFNKLGLSSFIHTWLGSNTGLRYTQRGGVLRCEEFNTNGGDFFERAQQELLQYCDVVVTNPPFSNAQFHNRIVESGKKFILLLPLIRSTHKTFSLYITGGKCWGGYNKYHNPKYKNKKHCSPVGYYTNMEVNRPFYYTGVSVNDLDKRYLDTAFNGEKVLFIETVKTIPDDYSGVMRVPATALWFINPKQYKIEVCSKSYTGKQYLNGDERYTGIYIRRVAQ